MTLREIFLPWSVIRQQKAKIAELRQGVRELNRRLSVTSGKLGRAQTMLKHAQPRDPATGRLIKVDLELVSENA